MWCEDNIVDPTTIIKDEYVRVSPWPVDISDEGVFNVAHTLSIGGNFLQGIRNGTEVHLTVVDNDGNKVNCTDLGVSNLFPRKLNSNQRYYLCSFYNSNTFLILSNIFRNSWAWN